MEVTHSVKKSVLNAYGTYQQHLKLKKEKTEIAKREKLNNSIQQLKLAKAKHLAKLVRQKKRLGTKRRLEALDASRKWKRIKTSL